MARQIKRKLNNDAGLTVLLALFGFLIAAMASFTIVTVSLGNAGRLESQQREQRDYLALSSAAALLRDSLAGESVTINEITDRNGNTTTSYSVSPRGGADGELSTALVKEIYGGGTGNLGRFSVNVGAELKSVEVTLDYSTSGTLGMSLRLIGAEDGATAPVSISLTGLHPVLVRDQTFYNTDGKGKLHFDRHEREQRVTFAAENFRAASG